LYSSTNIRVTKSRRMRWVGHAARMKRWDAYRVLVRKPKGKRELARYRHRWEHNIKIYLDYCRRVWTGFIWYRIGTCGSFLWIQ
jgi:hypothetical protein